MLPGQLSGKRSGHVYFAPVGHISDACGLTPGYAAFPGSPIEKSLTLFDQSGDSESAASSQRSDDHYPDGAAQGIDSSQLALEIPENE